MFASTAARVLHRVPATGGSATPVTRFDASRGQNSHRFPFFLPDGRHFLYVVRSERPEHRGIYVASLDSASGDRVVEGTDWGAQYVPAGSLLFLRGTTLMAQPFDAERLTVTGEPVAIAQAVGATTTSYGAFSASQTGVLVYASQIGLKGELRWFDRAGMPLGSVAPAAEYTDFELSPDERTVAMSRVDPQPNTPDIWLLDLARGITSRFTTDPMTDASPLWSPDGSRIVFRSNRRGTLNLMLMAVPIGRGTVFNAGSPKALFEAKVPLTGSPYRANYAVAANGQRFLVNTSVESATPSSITVVLNWTSALKQ